MSAVQTGIGANVNPFISAMGRAASAVQSTGSKMTSVGGRMTAIWDSTIGKINRMGRSLLGLAGVGGLGILGKNVLNMGVDFQTAFAEIETILGATRERTEFLKNGVLDMAGGFGTASELARGAYQAISAGVTDPVEALEFMQLAAKGATAGLASTFEAVDLGTTVINAFNLPASEFQNLFDDIQTTIRLGKVRFNELAATVGRAAPIFAAAGISTDEMWASISTLTAQGQRADIALTALRQVVRSLLKPTKTAEGILKKYGLENIAVTMRTQGFAAALGQLQMKIDPTSEDMNRLFGNIRAFQGVMPLITNASSKFANVLDQMENNAGELDRAAEKIVGTFRFQWLEVFNQSKAILTKAMLPALEQMADFLQENKVRILEFVQRGVNVAISAVQFLARHIDAIVTGLKAFGTMLIVGKVLSWVGGIMQAVGALGNFLAGVFKVSGALAGFRAAAMAIFGFLGGPAGWILMASMAILSVDKIRNSILGTLWKALVFAKDAVLGVIDTFKSWWDATERTRIFIAEFARVLISRGISAMKQLIAIGTAVAKVLFGLTQAVSNWLNRTLSIGPIIARVSLAVKAIRGVFKSLFDSVVAVAKKLIEFAGGWERVKNAIKDSIPFYRTVEKFIGEVTEEAQRNTAAQERQNLMLEWQEMVQEKAARAAAENNAALQEQELRGIRAAFGLDLTNRAGEILQSTQSKLSEAMDRLGLSTVKQVSNLSDMLLVLKNSAAPAKTLANEVEEMAKKQIDAGFTTNAFKDKLREIVDALKEKGVEVSGTVLSLLRYKDMVERTTPGIAAEAMELNALTEEHKNFQLELVDTINGYAQWFKFYLTQVPERLRQQIQALGLTTAQQEALAKALMDKTNPAALETAKRLLGIGDSAGSAAQGLFNLGDELQNIANSFSQKLAEMVLDAKSFGEVLRSLTEGLVKKFFVGMVQNFITGWKDAVATSEEGTSKIKAGIKGGFEALKKSVSGTGAAITSALMGMTGDWMGIFTSFFSAVVNFASGNFVGGLIGALGGIVGGLKKLFGGGSPAEKVMKDGAVHLGMTFSKELAETIAKTADTIGDRVTAILLHLPDIIEETFIDTESTLLTFINNAKKLLSSLDAGIIGTSQTLTALTESWDALLEKTLELGSSQGLLELTNIITDVINRFKEGQFTIGQTVDFIEDKFQSLVDNASKFGDAGAAAIRQIIEASRAAGLQIESVTQFVIDSVTKISAGTGNIIGALFEKITGQHKTLMDLKSGIAENNKEFARLSRELEQVIATEGASSEKARELRAEMAQLERQTERWTARLEKLEARMRTGKRMEDEFKFSADALALSIQDLVRQGVSWSQISEIFGEQLKQLGIIAGEFNTKLPPMVAGLADFMVLLEDKSRIKNLADGLQSMTTVLQEIRNAGLEPTLAMMESFENQFKRTLRAMIANGQSTETILITLGPQIAMLADMQRLYGFEIDNVTKKLLEQAGIDISTLPMGQLGTLQLGFETLIMGINELIRVMGGVPVEFGGWSAAAEEENPKAARAAEKSAGKSARAYREASKPIVSKLIHIGDVGVKQFNRIRDAGIEAAKEFVAAWSWAQHQTVGGSSILDIAKMGSRALTGLGKTGELSAVNTADTWSSSASALESDWRVLQNLLPTEIKAMLNRGTLSLDGPTSISSTLDRRSGLAMNPIVSGLFRSPSTMMTGETGGPLRLDESQFQALVSAMGGGQLHANITAKVSIGGREFDQVVRDRVPLQTKDGLILRNDDQMRI